LIRQNWSEPTAVQLVAAEPSLPVVGTIEGPVAEPCSIVVGKVEELAVEPYSTVVEWFVGFAVEPSSSVVEWFEGLVAEVVLDFGPEDRHQLSFDRVAS
jgi:hypothetical protein